MQVPRHDRHSGPDVASRMAKSTSPSPIIEVFVREVHASFPDSEKSKLATHERDCQDDLRRDPHRAVSAPKWAIRMADDKSQKHPRWEQLKERHQMWKDEWFAVRFRSGATRSPEAAPTTSSVRRSRWKTYGSSGSRTRWPWPNDSGRRTDGELPWEELLTELIDDRGRLSR